MRSLVVLVLLTATAHAGNNELSFTESTRALRTSSANAVTDDSLASFGFIYARNLGSGFVPHLELWTQATYQRGSADGLMFQTLSTELRTHAFMVGGQLRYELRRRIVASARLDIGTTRAALAIRDEMGHSASDHGWGAMTAGALALDFYAYRGPSFAMGLRIEAGAVATSSVPLTATPDSGSKDTLQLEMTAASLGSLNLSGPSLAFAFLGQF